MQFSKLITFAYPSFSGQIFFPINQAINFLMENVSSSLICMFQDLSNNLKNAEIENCLLSLLLSPNFETP
jgi:hypothetical protein